MKKSLAISLIVGVLTVPMIAHAKVDSNSMTRDEVAAQVVQAEKDGTLHQSKVHYPDYNTTASAVSQQPAQAYGIAPVNFSQSGSRVKAGDDNRLFEHH